MYHYDYGARFYDPIVGRWFCWRTCGRLHGQTIAYTYNERGWLEESVSPLFSQYLEYNASADPQYNGNISGQSWRHGTGALQSYSYTYDKVNRLLKGEMPGGLGRETLSYDKMGNILGLERTGTSSTVVDQLGYSYAYNRLSSVSDAAGGSSGPYQLGCTTAYTYDANGNMTGRTNGTNSGNNISSVTYNHLGLAQTITATAGTTTYTYDAMGSKLRSVFGSRVTDYIDGIEYEDGNLNFIHMEEGRIVKSASTFGYEYILKDHLGNSRSGFKGESPSVASIRSDYYPFGLQYQSDILAGTPENKYLYNGKEVQDGTNLYDYSARLYDPLIGRWGAVDPLSEKYVDISPYVYVADNPIKYIDIDGREIVDPKGNRVTYNVNKYGTLTWSPNATADIKRIGNAMSQTNIGLQALSKLDKVDFDVSMTINKTDLIKEANGAIRNGFSTPTIDSKRNIVKYDVTVYEKGIDETSTSPEGTRPVVMKDGERVYMDNYTKDEHIGAVGVHEARHVTDKESRGFQNKGKDVEKAPNSDQLKHYRELDERKKQGQ